VAEEREIYKEDTEFSYTDILTAELWASLSFANFLEVTRLVKADEPTRYEYEIQALRNKIDSISDKIEQELRQDFNDTIGFEIKKLELDKKEISFLSNVISLWSQNLSSTYFTVKELVEEPKIKLFDLKIAKMKNEVVNSFQKQFEIITNSFYERETKIMLGVLVNTVKTNYLYIKGKVNE